jgi:hypothetical protein
VDAVKLYERQLEQARADLAHILAAIRLFEVTGDPKRVPKYMDLHRLFRRGETWALCKAALAKNGPMTTKELSVDLMRARGLESGDVIMARALGMRLVKSLRRQELRGQLVLDRKRKGVSVWRLPTT